MQFLCFFFNSLVFLMFFRLVFLVSFLVIRWFLFFFLFLVSLLFLQMVLISLKMFLCMLILMLNLFIIFLVLVLVLCRVVLVLIYWQKLRMWVDSEFWFLFLIWGWRMDLKVVVLFGLILVMSLLSRECVLLQRVLELVMMEFLVLVNSGGFWGGLVYLVMLMLGVCVQKEFRVEYDSVVRCVEVVVVVVIILKM